MQDTFFEKKNSINNEEYYKFFEKNTCQIRPNTELKKRCLFDFQSLELDVLNQSHDMYLIITVLIMLT